MGADRAPLLYIVLYFKYKDAFETSGNRPASLLSYNFEIPSYGVPIQILTKIGRPTVAKSFF
eukprot:scaffold406_cov57-Cylindrotheca_fusiformis.AAC.17